MKMPLRSDPPRAAWGSGLVHAAAPWRSGRALRPVLCGVVLALALCLSTACGAAAAPSMVSIFQDDPHLEANPAQTLAQMRMAGATVVKVVLHWSAIAPNPRQRHAPRGFNPANPAAYPAGNWNAYDRIVRDAAADGMTVDFQLGVGAPVWATAASPAPWQTHSGIARNKTYPNWMPSPAAFAAFVRAAGIRYSGTYRPKGAKTPLPRLTFWSIWNEPNLGFELAPQGVPGDLTVPNSGRMY